MAEITQQDFIASEEIVKEIHKINEALLGVVKTGKEIGTSIKGADSIRAVKDETTKLTASQAELQKIEKQIATVQAKNNEEYLKQKRSLADLNTQLKQKTALGDRDARTINSTNASLKELNAALQKNKDAYKSLANEEARASKEGQELKAIIDAQDKAVKQQNESLGDFRDSVGHYEKGIKGLKQELIAARNEMANIAKTTGSQTSPEFLAAAEKAGQLKDEINDLNDSLKNASASKFENLGNSLKDVGSKLANLDFEGAMNSAKQFASIAKSISFKDLSVAAQQFGSTMVTVGKTLLTNPLFIMAAVIGAVVLAFKYFKDKADEFSKRQIANYKRELESLTTRYDQEIKLQKILGKQTFELEKAKQKLIIDNAEKSIKAIGKVQEFDLLSTFLTRSYQTKVNEEKLQQSNEYVKAKRDAANELKIIEAEQAEFERKSSADIAKQKVEDLFNLNKFRLTVAIEGQKEIIDSEKVSFENRIEAVNKFNKLKNDLAKLERENALKEEGLTADGIKLINEKLYNDLIKNQKDASDERAKIEGERLAGIEKNIAKAGEKIASTFKKPVPVTLFDSISTGIGKAVDSARFKLDEFKTKALGIIANIQDAFNKYAVTTVEFFKATSDSRIAKLDEEKQALEIKHAREIELAGDNEAAKTAIDKRYEASKAKIDKKIIEEKQKQARLDKALAIFQIAINTAKNIIEVFPNPYLIALAIATGAIQAAAVAAKPIPKFFKGTKSAPGGAAMVGEQGIELMRKPGEDWELTPSMATVMDIPKGTEIIPHKETLQRLAQGALSQNGGMQYVDNSNKEVVSEIRVLNKNLNKLKPIRQNLVRSGATVYHAIEDGKKQVKILRGINLGRWL